MASTRPPQSGNNKNPKKKPPQAQPITAGPKSNPAASERPIEPKRPVSPASAESKPPTIRSSSGSTAPSRRPRNAPPPPKKSNLPIYLIGGLVTVVIAAVALILVLNNGSDNTPKSGTSDGTNTSTGSTIAIAADPSAKVETFDNQGQDHIKPGTKHVPYNSDPPTSGPHFETALPWGVYQQPLTDEYAVHNLEHGGIVMYYDCTKDCESVINQLTVYGRRYAPNVFTGIMVAPRQNMPDGAKIAVTAWRTRLLLKSLDTTKINEFIKNYFNKAPESAG